MMETQLALHARKEDEALTDAAAGRRMEAVQ